MKTNTLSPLPLALSVLLGLVLPVAAQSDLDYYSLILTNRARTDPTARFRLPDRRPSISLRDSRVDAGIRPPEGP